MVIEEFKKDIDAHPEAEIFGFTQEDSSLEVDNEKNRLWTEKYGRSGILIRFCNVLIRELNRYTQEKYGKTAKLSTFAYSHTRRAPMEEVDGQRIPIYETCICDDNLIIQFALFGNIYYHGRSALYDPKIIPLRPNFWDFLGRRTGFFCICPNQAHNC